MEVFLLESDSGGSLEESPEFFGGFIGAMMLYMVILLYAVAVMRAVLEEKTTRVVEILISSVRPWELMLGKILGVGSVGLTQLAVWISIGVLGFVVGLPALMTARPEMADPELILRALPGAGLLALFAALFLGGYFLYAALYAAVGAMCSTEEEAQQAQFPVIMLLVVPVMFLMPIIQNPSSPLSVGTSLVPFFSPILLYARAATGTVAALNSMRASSPYVSGSARRKNLGWELPVMSMAGECFILGRAFVHHRDQDEDGITHSRCCFKSR